MKIKNKKTIAYYGGIQIIYADSKIRVQQVLTCKITLSRIHCSRDILLLKMKCLKQLC